MDDIVLFQILPRLPARSIGRFMSVCKQWHSYLTSPMFTKMHLHHVNNQNHPKIIALSAKYPSSYFQTMDCETPEVGLSAKRSLPFETKNNRMRILSSLNGLVCVRIVPRGCNCNYSYIILWNPLTGEYKRLSKDNSHGNFVSVDAIGYGFYYTSCDDDYKLLRVAKSSDAYIYSWKSESWRKAKSRVDSLLETWDCNCLLNEKLYFVAQGTHGSSSEWSSLIIRFDTKTEMVTEIATPSSSGKCYDLMVVGGCIHLCVLADIDSDHKVVLWKMDGDGEWTKVIRYSMSPIVYQPCHLMKNGNWLLLSCRRVVVVYKVNGKDVKRVSKYAIDNTMLLLLHGKFVETIVSLKRLSLGLSPNEAEASAPENNDNVKLHD